MKSVIKKKSDQYYQVNSFDARYDLIRQEPADRYESFAERYEEDTANRLRLPMPRFKIYSQHIETGKNYSNFTGGITWPYFEKPGALVVLGIAMPEALEALPGIEILEVVSGDTNRGLIEAMAGLRGKYGAFQDANMLRIWYGPSNNTQMQAVIQFQEENREEYEVIVTPPYYSEEEVYYENALQLIIGYLQKDAAGEKRLSGLANFKNLEFEAMNLSRDEIKGQIVNYPALAALCHGITSVNPQLLKGKTWLEAITRTSTDQSW